MELFEGTFDFVDSYGVDDYLTALGVGQILRKVYAASRPLLEISRNENPKIWNFKIYSILHVYEVELKAGEAVDDETLDARPCKTIMTVPKNGIILRQIPKEGPEVKVILLKHGKDSDVITISHNAEGRHICSFDFKRLAAKLH